MGKLWGVVTVIKLRVDQEVQLILSHDRHGVGTDGRKGEAALHSTRQTAMRRNHYLDIVSVVAFWREEPFEAEGGCGGRACSTVNKTAAAYSRRCSVLYSSDVKSRVIKPH